MKKTKLLCLILGVILFFGLTIGVQKVFADENPSNDLLSIYNKRSDLQKAFPGVKNKDYKKLNKWARKYGWKESDELLDYSPIYTRLSEMIDSKIEKMYKSLQLELKNKPASIPTGINTNSGRLTEEEIRNIAQLVVNENIVNFSGQQGEKGEKGEKGDKGDNGEISTIGSIPDGYWKNCCLVSKDMRCYSVEWTEEKSREECIGTIRSTFIRIWATD